MSDWPQLHEDPSTPSLSGSAPSSVPQSGGMNLDTLLQNIAGTGPSAGLVNAANTPVSGGHAGQVPSAFMRQVQPFQAQPMNNQKVVGKHAAKMQGVGNVITAATNAIGSFMTMKAQQKQDQTKDAATKVLQTQSALDEATQQKESAEAMMKTTTGAEYEANKKIFDTATAKVEAAKKQQAQIFADPKLGKSLVKGFNISHTDPSLNNTDEHKAVISAMQEFKNAKDKQAKQAAQQTLQQAQGAENAMLYRQQSPQSAGAPNQMAQQRLEAYQQQRKDAIETFKAMGPIYAAQLRAQGDVTVEGMRGATDLRKAAIDAEAKLDEQILKNQQANLDNEAARSLERMRDANARSLELLKQGNPIEVLKSFNDAQKNYETSITENQKSRQALNNELDKASTSRAFEIRRQLQAIDASDEQARNAFTLNRNVIAKGLNVSVDDPRLQIPTVQVGEGAGNATTSGSSSSTVSTDLDPRTGNPWKSNVPATDRLIIRAYYEAGIIRHSVNQTVDSINRDVRKVERFFDPDENTTD